MNQEPFDLRKLLMKVGLPDLDKNEEFRRYLIEYLTERDSSSGFNESSEFELPQDSSDMEESGDEGQSLAERLAEKMGFKKDKKEPAPPKEEVITQSKIDHYMGILNSKWSSAAARNRAADYLIMAWEKKYIISK